ncbi:MAG: hypothetical protein M3Y87_09220 [Myxococcota bacterium]|nr:hypothetical protein [Myxococcota bacterium]
MSVHELAFAALWEKDGRGFAGHLPLLGLRDCAREIAIIREVVAKGGDTPSIVAMLADPNWRPNLVAATAVLFHPRDGALAAPLWRALDEGSWVSPQLAVVLSFHDTELVPRAIERVERRCPMKPERWGERVAGKPNPKALSALLALLDDLAPDDACRLRADPDIAALIGLPYEDGDRIARSWRERIIPHLAE